MPLIASAKGTAERSTGLSRRAGKEKKPRGLFSELPVEVLEQFAVRDTYFTDSRTFEVIGHSVCIDDETLAEAISALPVDRRDIILLSYFLDMSDAEIANVLNMVRRSVAYRRTSTLKLLKNLMGGENR